jgi:hypothetical protein
MGRGSGPKARGTVERELGRVVRTVRQVAGSFDAARVPGELGREAQRAWGVLTREHAADPAPRRFLPRLWHWGRLFYLGVSAKLAPARRLLFVLCLVATGLGLQANFQVGGRGVLSFPSPLLLLAFAGLVLLLMLELADRVTVRDELEVARELQRDLLPGSAPDLPGWGFAFSSRTANTIGGDYLDFLPVPDGRLAVVIGDASGHGIAAGLLMAVANTALRLAQDHDPGPAAVAATVNRALVRVGDRRAFMSLFYGLLDPVSGRLEYVCAGHPFPCLRRVDGAVEELGRGGLPLGMRTEVEPALGEVTIGPGDLLALYTDGVPEELSPAGEAFGFDRVRTLVAQGGSAQTLHERLVDEMERHRGDERAHDDRSLVVVERLG